MSSRLHTSTLVDNFASRLTVAMGSLLFPLMAYLGMEDLKERALWQVTLSLFAGSGVWMNLCFLATQTRRVGEVLSREHLFHHGYGERWPPFFSHY